MNHQMRRFSENVFLKYILQPTANVTDGAFPASGSYIDVAEYERFAFLFFVGATDDTSVAVKVQQATTNNGTLKDVTGAALTATSLAGTNDNKWGMIEIERSKLDIANDYRYVSLVVAATGGTATICGGFFIGWRTRTLPPTYGADKAEIVIVDG